MPESAVKILVNILTVEFGKNEEIIGEAQISGQG